MKNYNREDARTGKAASLHSVMMIMPLLEAHIFRQHTTVRRM